MKLRQHFLKYKNQQWTDLTSMSVNPIFVLHTCVRPYCYPKTFQWPHLHWRSWSFYTAVKTGTVFRIWLEGDDILTEVVESGKRLVKVKNVKMNWEKHIHPLFALLLTKTRFAWTKTNNFNWTHWYKIRKKYGMMFQWATEVWQKKQD